MVAIKDTNQIGQTVVYNGVQFGGTDSDHTMMPPDYRLAGTPIYDEAGRSVTHVQYVLSVSTVIFGTSEAVLSSTITDMQTRLTAAGKSLSLSGLGVGFARNPQDIIWGPKPGPFNFAPVGGQCAWEIQWSIEFNVNHCMSAGAGPLTWMAWNYSTAWDNDLEGLTTRVISGHVQIIQQRQPGNRSNIVAHTVDEARKRIVVVVPDNFRRTRNTWREASDKQRIDFSVVDAQLPSDAPPVGIIEADGNFSVNTTGVGFAKGGATVSATLTVAPGVPRSVAMIAFMSVALAKQRELLRAGGDRVNVMPSAFTVNHQMWSRTTSFSMTWDLAGCIQDILFRANIWEPVPGTSYRRWRASVEHLWENRGSADLISLAGDDLIIDVCQQVTGRTFGNSPRGQGDDDRYQPFRYACPDIPAKASWLAYDIRVRVIRKDNQTTHRKAVAVPSSILNNIVSGTVSSLLPGPRYQVPAADKHVTEYNGVPTVRVLLQFKGLRVKFLPDMPVLSSVGGHRVILKGYHGGAPEVVFDMAGCPVYFLNVAAEYEVVGGDIPRVEPLRNPSICDSPGVITNPGT